MKIFHRFENYTKKRQLQILEIECNPSNLEEAESLGYDDFEVNLFIGNKLIADISHVLSKTEGYTTLIDSINWVEKYKDFVTEPVEETELA